MHSKKPRRFFRAKDFYRLLKDFLEDRKDFCQRCVRFVGSDMPLGLDLSPWLDQNCKNVYPWLD